MPAAGVVMIIAVVLIVAALVYFLVSTIVALQQDHQGPRRGDRGRRRDHREERARRRRRRRRSTQTSTPASTCSRACSSRRPAWQDAVGLVDGLYPGAAAAGFRNFPDSTTTKAPRIAEVYTRGTLTLARLGREAPIAAASPDGPALRNPPTAAWPRGCCTRRSGRRGREPAALAGHRHRLAGAVRAASDDAPGVRKRMPARQRTSRAKRSR